MFLMTLFLVPLVFADRNTSTVTAYKASTLIQRGGTKLYSVTFTASANGGDFMLIDDTEQTPGASEILANTKAEGSEVTALGSQHQDFSDKPLLFRDGLYLVINDGYAIVEYE